MRRVALMSLVNHNAGSMKGSECFVNAKRHVKLSPPFGLPPSKSHAGISKFRSVLQAVAQHQNWRWPDGDVVCSTRLMCPSSLSTWKVRLMEEDGSGAEVGQHFQSLRPGSL